MPIWLANKVAPLFIKATPRELCSINHTSLLDRSNGTNLLFSLPYTSLPLPLPVPLPLPPPLPFLFPVLVSTPLPFSPLTSSSVQVSDQHQWRAPMNKQLSAHKQIHLLPLLWIISHTASSSLRNISLVTSGKWNKNEEGRNSRGDLSWGETKKRQAKTTVHSATITTSSPGSQMIPMLYWSGPLKSANSELKSQLSELANCLLSYICCCYPLRKPL